MPGIVPRNKTIPVPTYVSFFYDIVSRACIHSFDRLTILCQGIETKAHSNIGVPRTCMVLVTSNVCVHARGTKRCCCQGAGTRKSYRNKKKLQEQEKATGTINPVQQQEEEETCRVTQPVVSTDHLDGTR